MNIESKRYKVLDGHVAGSCRLIVKDTGRLYVIARPPSAEYLAAISERRFDKECELALVDFIWP